MTLKEFYKKFGSQMESHIINSLNEDNVNRDITTQLLFDKKLSNHMTKARLVCKEDCVLAGKDIFLRVFKLIKPSLSFSSKFNDGDFIRKGSVVLSLEAPNYVLLAGERTALNYLQKMSGVATLTRQFVKKLKYPGSKVLHTRKTTPGFRIFEIAAVKTGGGDFHRMDLGSAVLIKDNHIKIIMLDNLIRPEIQKALKLLKNSRIKIELSGGINLHNISKIQFPGIDYYSVGSLTHGYKSIDYSLEF
jgi:nicotinate-nucleotide pyrophosphorylase (carboxylating)